MAHKLSPPQRLSNTAQLRISRGCCLMERTLLAGFSGKAVGKCCAVSKNDKVTHSDKLGQLLVIIHEFISGQTVFSDSSRSILALPISVMRLRKYVMLG